MTPAKVCTKCKQDKPITDYAPQKGGKYGRRSICRVCSRIQTKISSAKNPNHKAQDRAIHREKYWSDPEYRAATIARVKAYRERNRHILTRERNKRAEEHYNWSAQKVYQAVKSGKLPHISTQKCCRCGQPACHYHHHNGYDKEHILDVIPMCRRCHNEAHLLN